MIDFECLECDEAQECEVLECDDDLVEDQADEVAEAECDEECQDSNLNN
jgi:hypothetical protein